MINFELAEQKGLAIHFSFTEGTYIMDFTEVESDELIFNTIGNSFKEVTERAEIFLLDYRKHLRIL